jgi:hypothetical protein
MGIKLGDISPLAGAGSGKGLFGKGLAKLADSGAGFLIPASYLAKSQRDKNRDKEEASEAERKKSTGMKRGGKVSAAQAVHKHERAKHKGQPLTKMAKGGSASKRADGCATKGKTKGRFV